MFQLFVGTYIGQGLVSALWISIGLGLPKFMLKLVEFPLGTIHLFLSLLKLWTPLPKVPLTSDIMLVLAYIQSLHTAGFSLHLLSSIALFLTVHSSISRVSRVAHLGSPLLEQRDSREIAERTVSCLYVIYLFHQGKKC